MKASEIADRVIMKLDEYSPFIDRSGQGSPAPIIEGDELISELKPVYSYANAHLEEAANEMLMVIPLNYTNVKVSNIIPIIPYSKVAEIAVPIDFLRLHTIKADDWTIPVHTAISITDPLYEAQHNEWTRGTVNKPVVVLDEAVGKLSLYTTTGTTIDKFVYVPKFTATDTTTEYNDRVGELIALNCAKKVMEVYGNAEGFNAVTAEMTNLLQIMKG